MNEEEKTICSVKSTEWPWTYTFRLTPDALIREWTKPVDTANGSERFPLADLSPRLSHQMEFGYGSQPLLRKALVFLAGSACVFFSEFNKQIPLLAPFLAVPGLWALIAGASRIRQYDWTIIRRKNGDRASFILNTKANRSEMEIFERQFVETVANYCQKKDTANQASATSEPARGAGSSSPQG